MYWNYDFAPTIWLSFLVVLLLTALAGYSWSRRSVPGAVPFTIALLFAALWAAGSVMEYAAADAAAMVAWIKFQAVWHLPTATAITCFILEYAWPGRWLTRRVVALLSVPPLLILLLILTNDFHHLMWLSFTFDKTITPVLGWVSWVAIFYGYSFVIVDIAIFGWLFIRSPQHRGFVIIMLAGQSVVRLVYLLDRTSLIQTDLPMDVFGITFAYVMYTSALFRYRILDPNQLARQTLITQMREGMLVLDPQGRVVSLNPAAEQILGITSPQARGAPVRELLPVLPEGNPCLEEAEIEFSVSAGQAGSGSAVHHYAVAISPLKDWRGLQSGCLVLLHDVTGQKLVQTQILEQQRALATLKERDQIARELHDHLAQELALINVQAQLVCGLLEADQAVQAQDQLQTLAELAREIQGDVRGQIQILSLCIPPEGGFLSALRRQLEIFQNTHGIRTELVSPFENGVLSFLPMAEVQLLRIIQEALTNIGKHSRAKLVRIELVQKPGQVDLIIEDDGVGFDPHRLPAPGQSFGLGIMTERACEINVRLDISSAPNAGTRIRMEVPYEQQGLPAGSSRSAVENNTLPPRQVPFAQEAS
jgi:PAS domain S-box-containing protein